VSKYTRCAAPNGIWQRFDPSAGARFGSGSAADKHGFYVPNQLDEQLRGPPRQSATNHLLDYGMGRPFWNCELQDRSS
jgi:hypothetical protein